MNLSDKTLRKFSTHNDLRSVARLIGAMVRPAVTGCGSATRYPSIHNIGSLEDGGCPLKNRGLQYMVPKNMGQFFWFQNIWVSIYGS